MSVEAKFYVQSVTRTPSSEGGVVKLGAATRGSRNREWAQSTPSGSIELSVNNPSAFGWFEDLVKEAQASSSLAARVHPEVSVSFRRSVDMDSHVFEPTPVGHYNAGQCVACGASESAH
jgi:hypothetical protein